MLKKKISLCFKVTLFILLFACIIGYLTPRKWHYSWQASCDVTIYVANQGIHTSIIAPAQNRYFNWNQSLPATEVGREKKKRYNYLAFGWGDRAFMLATPSLAEIDPTITLKALFLPTPSTLQVGGYQTLPQNIEIKRVKIQGEDYLRLVDFIKNSFQLDRQGNKIKIGYGYHSNDSFYEAKGSYSILRGCNDWTAEALRKADINTPLWSTLSSAIMFHLNSGCNGN